MIGNLVRTAGTMHQPDEAAIAAYLANRLPEREARAFERYCLADAEFARHVERELAFKDGLRQLTMSDAQAVARSENARRMRWPYALAASVILMSIVAWTLRPVASPPPITVYRSFEKLPLGLKNAAVAHIGLMHLRGPTSSSYAVPANGLVELRVLADLPGDSYTITLNNPGTDGNGAQVLAGLRPKAGFVTVYFPANQVIGKEWLIGLKPSTTGQMAAEYPPFEVRFDATLPP